MSVGYHETELVLVRDLVRADDVVVDVGANIGVYTVVSALRGARVLAFEPNADARLLLFANIELNEIRERVQVLSYGLGNFSGRAGFTTDLEERNHLAAGTELGRELIEVRRLDELLLPAGRLALMKIDVEGYDEAVLEGAVETIKKHRPVMIIETWAGGESIRRFLGSLGYSFFIYRSSLQPISEDFAEDANLIAIHTEEIGSVRQRLLGSAPNVEMLPRVRWLRSPEWTESGSARQP